MAIQWMDNFNIYGTDAGRVARMSDGVYAQVSGALIVDPDPTAGGGQVFQGNTGTTTLRKVLSAARTTVGIAGRYWLTVLPGAPTLSLQYMSWRDVNNVTHVFVNVDPSGFLRVYRNDNAGNVLIASSAAPVIITNAWQHIEGKLLLDAAAGSITIKIEGVTVVNQAGIRTTSDIAGAVATCMQVASGGNTHYIKDLIVWDDQGALNNNFLGSCQVYKIVPSADVALNWTPNPADGIGYDKINEVTPDDDTRYIQAPTPPPAAYKCALTDLPATVTSVKGVMPIHRSRKTDGGDGNIQIGAISGASTGLGADRPITTAYTYWWDIYDADPNGAVAWSRLAVNALNLQINRTL